MTISRSIDKFLNIVFLPLLVAHIIALLNLRFTLWPEMVVYPYLANNGFALYKDLINPYPPTLILVLSFLTRQVGYNPSVFQALTWFLIIVIDLTVYFITLKITRNLASALASLIFFTLISIPFGINGLWFDLVQTPIILLSAYYFYRFFQETDYKHLNFSFMLCVIAFFIKQQALWLIIGYIILLTVKERRNIIKIFRNLLPSLFLFVLIIACFVFYALRSNNLKEFASWVFIFPFLKASSMPGYINLPTPERVIPIILVFSLCLPSLLITKTKKYLIFVISLFLILFAYPRFDYFHLIPALAVLSIIFWSSFQAVYTGKTNLKFAFLFLAILTSIYMLRYIQRNNTSQIRFFEPEIFKTASFLELTTDKKDHIYIQNGPDQILPLASRLPVKPWVDEFPWYLENSNLQQSVVNSMIRENPKFIVYKPYDKGEKYALGVYRPSDIADYLDRKYADYFQVSENLWIKKKL